MRPAIHPSTSRSRSHLPALAYALDGSFHELPVIDLSHPAFAIDSSQAEIDERVRRALAAMRDWSASPPLKRALFSLRAKRSVLASAIASSRGGYLSGIATYLAKLGPSNLGRGFGFLDREIADSLPCYCARLRLRDAVSLAVEACRPGLRRAPGRPLYLVDIAGGAEALCLNALMELRRSSPGLLEGRSIRILDLDMDADAPAFAARCLDALRTEGMALSGLDISLRHIRYDWSEDRALFDLGVQAAADNALCLVASEGGLFDYARDEEVISNLRAFREGYDSGSGGEPTPWVGTASRSDGPVAFLNHSSAAALRVRSAAELERLATDAGYALTRSVENPLSRAFLLEGPALAS
ncbi:MAG TPA: hypothetical protein VMC79_15015 [Rectinemataceae bacterium]|nr:hypothetical protein [Rectinemataceae bacterium]